MTPEEVISKIREIDDEHRRAVEALEESCSGLGMELDYDWYDGFHHLKVDGKYVERFTWL